MFLHINPSILVVGYQDDNEELNRIYCSLMSLSYLVQKSNLEKAVELVKVRSFQIIILTLSLKRDRLIIYNSLRYNKKCRTKNPEVIVLNHFGGNEREADEYGIKIIPHPHDSHIMDLQTKIEILSSYTKKEVEEMETSNRILILGQNTELISRELKKQNFNVVKSKNTETALDLIKKEEFKLVILATIKGSDKSAILKSIRDKNDSLNLEKNKIRCIVLTSSFEVEKQLPYELLR